MTKSFPSDVVAVGSIMPRWETLGAYETAIQAISGLYGWYSPWSATHRIDAGGAVTQLTDRSAGARHLVQATGVNQPAVSANYFGSIGGVARDGVAFSGAADLYLDTAANFFDGSSHSWSYAALAVSQGTGQQCILSNAGGNEQLIQQTNLQWRFFTPTVSLNVPSNTGVISRVIGVRDDPGATNLVLTLEANGLSATSTVARANVAAGKLRLGLATPGSKRWNGVLAELIIKKGVFTEDDKTLIRAYLQFLYNPRP